MKGCQWDSVLINHLIKLLPAIDDDLLVWRGLCGANQLWRASMAQQWRARLVKDFSFDAAFIDCSGRDARVCLWWEEVSEYGPLLACLKPESILHMSLCMSAFPECVDKAASLQNEHYEQSRVVAKAEQLANKVQDLLGANDPATLAKRGEHRHLLSKNLALGNRVDWAKKQMRQLQQHILAELIKPGRPFGALLLVIEADLDCRRQKRDLVALRAKQEKRKAKWVETYDAAEEAEAELESCKQHRVESASAVGLDPEWTANAELYRSPNRDVAEDDDE